MSKADTMQSGHRQRLRKRFLEGGGKALADYELLELILFAARPRGDVKPLAKQLIREFGSLGDVLHAEPAALARMPGLGDAGIAAIKAIGAASEHMLIEKIKGGPIIQSWTHLLDYCKMTMGQRKKEQFRVLFLDQKHRLIADEKQQEGTVDHTPVYPREVLRRALELSASSVILVHNHPSGDPTPSKDDIEMTKSIANAARSMNIKLHDHLIIASGGHYSFKSNGLI